MQGFAVPKIQFRKVRSIGVDSEGAEHLFSLCERDTSHLSKTVSGFFGRYDYIIR